MPDSPASIGDRLAASFVMLLASFVTAAIVWVVIFFITSKGGAMVVFPFRYVWYFTGFFVVFAFVSPDRSLQYMGWIWEKIERFIIWMKYHG